MRGIYIIFGGIQELDLGCEVSLPAQFAGCYSFRSDALDQRPDLPNVGWYALNAYEVSFGDCSFELEPSFYSLIDVGDEKYTGQNTIDDYQSGAGMYPVGHPTLYYWGASITLRAFSPSDLLISDAIPLTPPDVELATYQKHFTWQGNGINGSNVQIHGHVYSLSVQNDQCGPPPDELLLGVISYVIALNLQQGISNSLDAKLSTILDSLTDLNDNNDASALNRLNAFINEVEAQRGNKISDADADYLVAAALNIIDLIQ